MRRVAPWVPVAIAIVAIGLLARGSSDSGRPLDPRSTGPLGARGVVELLEEMGARVEISPTVPRDDERAVAVLFVDELGRAQRDELRSWVEGGGTLVVADPASSFAPPLARRALHLDAGADVVELRPGCALPALGRVGTIAVPQPVLLRVDAAAHGCFSDDEGQGAYLVARSAGEGALISLGGGAPFTNERITEADNAVLAVSLLAPRPGSAVTVLERGAPGSGEETLTDLVPPGVRRGLWQLVAAFAVVVLWRGRRLAAPVEEPHAVDLPGSELVLATGNLLQHAGRSDAAADMLRAQLRDEIASRFGLPRDAAPEAYADVLAAHGVDPARVVDALGSQPVDGDRELVRLARAIESLRSEVTHA